MNEGFLQIDKLKHFWVSLLLFLSIFFIRLKLKLNKDIFYSIAYTIRDVLLIWFFKEFIDLFGFGNPEFLDFVADFVGIFIPIYIYFLIKALNKSRKEIIFQTEWDLFRKNFRETYSSYFIFKQNMKTQLKFLLFWKKDFSEDDYIKLLEENKLNFKDKAKILVYYSKSFLKAIIKLPLITIFSTFWLIYSSFLLIFIKKT